MVNKENTVRTSGMRHVMTVEISIALMTSLLREMEFFSDFHQGIYPEGQQMIISLVK